VEGQIVERLVHLFNKIWTTEEMPKDYTELTIIPTYLTRDKEMNAGILEGYFSYQ
jgi:hypothetical protein